MKNVATLTIIILLFTACQKNTKIIPANITQNPKKDTVAKIVYDTIPDNSTMFLRLVTDSIHISSVELYFKHTYHLIGLSSEDFGIGLQGAPQPTTFYALSSDNIDLQVDGIPYTHGMIINMDANALASGKFFIGANNFVRIPSSIHVWLKDTYMKDSLDLGKGNYPVTIDNSNPATYGRKRFQIILR